MKKTKILAAMALGLMVVGCRPAQTEAAQQGAVYRKITPEKAKEMMKESPVILDVRTPAEYAEGHIENAVLLPDYDLASRAEEVLPDKGAVILVYCRSGRRSEGAARQLVSLGYTGVHDFGGIVSWPYATVRE